MGIISKAQQKKFNAQTTPQHCKGGNKSEDYNYEDSLDYNEDYEKNHLRLYMPAAAVLQYKQQNKKALSHIHLKSCLFTCR